MKKNTNFKKILSEKGGATVLVFFTIFTFLIVLMGAFMSVSILRKSQVKSDIRIQEIYGENYKNVDEFYNELEKQLANNKDLPENTETTAAGTEVRLPSGWYSTTSAYISTEDGSMVKSAVKVASVTAVAIGGGESVPVPQGFYYVGGTKNSGVVISDNEADKNKYVNDEDGDIPKDLLGNQFVWIPVTAGDYKKVEWKLSNGNDASNALYDTSTSASELLQIQKYGGFYIARYEAGKGTVTSSSNVAIGSNIENSGWSYSGWSVNNYAISGQISSKADEIPYYHADYDTAVQMANNMYKTDYVQSGLVTGTMWDAMMNFIGSSNVSSTDWGNYLNKEITLASGKYRIISSDGSETKENVWTNGAGFETNTSTRYLLTTGSSEQVKKKNLYDVAGNLCEWSQEASFYDYSNASYRNYMLRGGSFDNSYSAYPACYRAGGTATRTSTGSGFRPALYIK